MRTVGVILGGGVGARLGLDVPKQMVKIAGKTILEHTVVAFNSSPEIDELIVMITPGWSEHVATLLGNKYEKLTLILEGGATRNETTSRVLDALGDDECKVVLHDAVRPLLDERIIKDCVDALDEFGAVDVVIPSADTIVEVDENEVITQIPNRERLRRGQTPQAFKASVLKRAYELAWQDPAFKATDDCGVVLKYLPEVSIKTVAGAEHNMKVTHPVDLFIADKLFQLASVGTQGHPSAEERASALKDKTIVVLGGSYGIGAEICQLASAAGANVVAHGRSTTGLHVQDPVAIDKAFRETFEKYGSIDAVVLTAGVLRMGRLADTSEEHILEAFGVNYLAPVHVAKAAYKYLVESKGHLLYFTSSSYTRGRENYSLYSSTKAAVVNLTQALSEEWAPQEIKVNVINPERTATPMRTQAFGEEPAGTLLSATSVAETSLDVLTSDITGLVIDVRKEQKNARSAGDAINVALANSDVDVSTAN
ncbi:SDR family NAD(P)-dependent oxidoreductase [Populibacterium corticicola]|uniref:2-C-methyl-D-erythritol 4-phosphate cytidylyltransferase n=1 Tax=Populibacterium corticicola TaxID=1812826 RepID=A0ABW5XC10_9MICO